MMGEPRHNVCGAAALLPGDVVPPENRTGGVTDMEPVLLPDLDALYRRRAGRLEALAREAEKQEDAAYLAFAAHLTRVQRQLWAEVPLTAEDIAVFERWLTRQKAPLAAELAEAPFWLTRVCRLVEAVAPMLPRDVAHRLCRMVQDRDTMAQQATWLLQGAFGRCEAALALPLWAALSVCWAQGVAVWRVHHSAKEIRGIHPPTRCPCCGGLPVGSLVMTGAREGLRYLQCSVCETRWHRVRSTCTVCGNSGRLDYWSLDRKDAPIEIESCGDCMSYGKVFRLDRQANLEAQGDDLTSLALDALVEEKGFLRGCVNPLILPVGIAVKS